MVNIAIVFLQGYYHAKYSGLFAIIPAVLPSMLLFICSQSFTSE